MAESEEKERLPWDQTPWDSRSILIHEQTDYGNFFRIGIIGQLNGKYYAVKNIELEEVDPYQSFPHAIILEREEAPKLLDSLMNAGILPSPDRLKKLQFNAMENHLEDMRKIVFDLLPLTIDNAKKE